MKRLAIWLGVAFAVFFIMWLIILGFIAHKQLAEKQVTIDELQKEIQVASQYTNILEQISPAPQHSDITYEQAEDMGFKVAKVGNTGSMRPTMNENSLILLDKSSPSVGDIIVFKNGGSDWVHRIIADTGTDWITQGDALKGIETEIVPKDDVLYRVTGILY
jgi:hypothetical protein